MNNNKSTEGARGSEKLAKPKLGYYYYKKATTKTIVQVIEVHDYFEDLQDNGKRWLSVGLDSFGFGSLEITFKAITNKNVDLFDFKRSNGEIPFNYSIDCTYNGFYDQFEWIEDQEMVKLLYVGSDQQ